MIIPHVFKSVIREDSGVGAVTPRYIFLGGRPFIRLLREWVERTPCRVAGSVNLYGPTEATILARPIR